MERNPESTGGSRRKPKKDMFITDMGRSMKAGTMTIPRYGVWAYDESKGKPQTIDTGDDLKKLKKKYGDLRVANLT